MSAPKRVAVVGAGVSGLASAQALLKMDPRIEVSVLEASNRPGGVLETHREGAFLLEQGPDSLVRTKPAAIDLCRELGVPLIETRNEHARSLVVRDGGLVPVPPGFQLVAPTSLWPMVTTPLFSWPAKLRMALDLVLPRRSGASLVDDENLASFVRRRLGQEALDRLIQPLIAGIYAGDPADLSLRSTMPRLLDMELHHRSLILGMRDAARQRKTQDAAGARYSLFVTAQHGMATLTDALAATLPPGALRLGATVVQVERAEGSWVLHVDDGSVVTADRLVLSVPAKAAATLITPIDDKLGSLLAGIESSSVTTVNLVWPRAQVSHPLDGFGFVCPRTEGRYLLACTFTSRKYEGRDESEHFVLRAFVAGESAHDDDATMLRGVRNDLSDLLGIDAQPQYHLISRYPQAMPRYDMGHQSRMDGVRQRLEQHPHLALCGNAYQGVGISDCVESGQLAAQRILGSFTDL